MTLVATALWAALVTWALPPLTASREAPPAASQPAASAQDNDRRVDPAQPDFTVIGLPTALRLPRYKSAFRVTHRFSRPLGQGDFGDLLEDFFGFDESALIGLEFRFGLMPGTQIGIHRTSGDKDIQFFLQHDVLRQGDRWPVGVAAILSAEGTNNFRDDYSPAIGAIVSRTLGRHGAVYIEPIWVNNTNPLPSDLVDDNDTFILGLAGRVRVRPTVYLVVEGAPRLGGFEPKPGATHAAFGIEKRVGGHAFQINFSNGFGTTFGQIARGGTGGDDWYIGFNISRKFF